MQTQTSAYDYDKQKWVVGREADALLLSQTYDELDLLEDDTTRDDYAQLIGLRPEHTASYTDTMRAQAERLERTLARQS